MNPMKFSEMSYTRPDIDALLGQCKALATKAAGAASGEELVNVYYEQSRAFADYSTAAQLASIHYTCDTRDAYWKAEQDFFDANGPAVENARVEISRAFLANAHVDALMILVNHTNKMPENYTFETAECGSKTAVNKTLQTVACNAFLELQKAAAAENVTVWMQSGYRSVSYQTNLYEKKTNYYKQQGYDDAKAKEMAAAIVNPPGYSEHNCGLAADLNSPEHTGLDEGFENTAAFRWLCQHAGEYGFILRYPKGAEEKTEITYEPWHWRYVGVENAAKINASGLCFEDYIAALQQIAG